MRKKIVAGNWKMNTTVQEGVDLVSSLLKGLDSIESNDVQVVVIPPFTHLARISEKIGKDSSILLGAQNCFHQPEGAYTGEISCEMLQNLGVSFVLVGHSERREYFGEKGEMLTLKLKEVLRLGMVAVYCCGEPLQEREEARHFKYVEDQIRDCLFPLNPEDISNIVVAYEPVWAIGTGKVASPKQVDEMHRVIRTALSSRFTEDLASKISHPLRGKCNFRLLSISSRPRPRGWRTRGGGKPQVGRIC